MNGCHGVMGHVITDIISKDDAIEIAHGSLRLTLSEETTKEEIDHTVDCLKKIVEKLRAMSPLYEDFIKKNRK